jgi:hypothetical protein
MADDLVACTAAHLESVGFVLLPLAQPIARVSKLFAVSYGDVTTFDSLTAFTDHPLVVVTPPPLRSTQAQRLGAILAF